MQGLSDAEGAQLPALARDELNRHFQLEGPEAPSGSWLLETAASFVTLLKDSDLRGCIGTLEAWRSLEQDVRANVSAAALADSRFQPVQADELPSLRIETSVLSSPEPFEVADEETALVAIRPGVDGLTLRCGKHRSTFLPQVWEQLPEPRDFFAQLKHKAGLPEDSWPAHLKLWRYTVRKWKEDERSP